MNATRVSCVLSLGCRGGALCVPAGPGVNFHLPPGGQNSDAVDTVDVAWRGGISLRATKDPRIWSARWNPDPGLPPLVEVGNVTIGSPTWAPLEPGDIRWVFLKTDSGVWISGEQAYEELERLEKLRQQYFAGPVVAPESTQAAPEFYVLAIADNLLLTRDHRVPGMSLTPMTSVLGDDIRVVLNELLQQRGFRQALMPDQWIEKMRRDRPAVLIECRVKAETPGTAQIFSSEVPDRRHQIGAGRRVRFPGVTSKSEFHEV